MLPTKRDQEPELDRPKTVGDSNRHHMRPSRGQPGRFILPKEMVYYSPPETWPESAQEYLRQLARTGTSFSATKLAHVSTASVATWREELEGFEEEERAARESLVELIREEGFFMAFNAKTEKVKADMIRFMLEKLDRKNFGKEQKVELSGELGLTWVDIMNMDEG